MRTVRRLYFYLVALISLEVVVWGVISLARTLFQILPIGGTIDQLASGLSLVLVGLPVFLLHWSIVQRDARRDEEERNSRLRSFFLYCARFVLLSPVAYSTLAIISRTAMQVFGASTSQALIGAGQTLADNLVAIVANAVAWLYIERVLRKEWQNNPHSSELPEARRVYRYAWALYTLAMLVSGCYLIIRFILYTPEGLTNQLTTWLANGIALVVVGAPLFTGTWLIIEETLTQSDERRSTLRLAVLYLLSLAGAFYTLISVSFLLYKTLRWLLGEGNTLQGFLTNNSAFIAMTIPMAVLWAYFGRKRQALVAGETDLLRRAGLERIYRYTLVLLGNAVTLLGVWQITSTLVYMLFGLPLTGTTSRDEIARALGNLLVGLPLWLRTWPLVQAEAQGLDDAGDHARRSVVRKTYLYLVLFATVVGVMVSGGSLLYHIFSNLLAGPGGAAQGLVPGAGMSQADFWNTLAHRAQTVVIIGVWLLYHLSALRQDGKKAQQALTNRHAGFMALIVQADEHPFASELAATLKRQAPHLPVVTHRLDLEPLGIEQAAARVLVLPAALAAQPPDSLTNWLKDYTGQRIVVPLPSEKWIWLGNAPRSTRDLVAETARAVRSLAEGRGIHPTVPSGPWTIVSYILAGLFALELLLMLFSLAMSFIMQ